MNKKCVLLFSGGLDSTLAAYILKEQNIDFYPFNLKTPFCQCNANKRCQNIISDLNIKIHTELADKSFLDMVKNPKYGYGSAMNPCMDCRIYLLKKAKKYMQEIGASFVATGEVLDQRDMSQHLWQLKQIEKESGLEGLVLRPLSAKLLPETLPEKENVVNREKLYSIHGKQRKEQINLAKKFGITDTSTGCGCLLADKNYKNKIKEFFENFTDYEIEDATLLRVGRHFYFPGTKIVLGKNELENKILASYYKKEKFLLIEPDTPGPTALCYLNSPNKNVPSLNKQQIISLACELIKKYSKPQKLSGSSSCS
jgi:tRNA U34 2-thiouridine synthase MnmA/TrmU